MAPAKKAANVLPTRLEERPLLDLPRKTPRLLSVVKVAALGLLGAGYYFSDEIWNLRPEQHLVSAPVSAPELCPQVEPITPHAQISLLEALDTYLFSAEGSEWTIESLAGAVRVPSVF